MATTKATLLGHRSATSFSDLTLSGDLTVNGTTTTLDTTVQNVDKLEIGASSTDYGAKINQASTGNILQLQDNGTDVMVVKDGGNVGIGVSDPDVELEIKKSSANARLAINAGDGNDPHLYFRSGDANDFAIYVDGSETNDPLKFYDYASASNMMTLENGNVGIGTSSPSSNADTNLHVKGTSTASIHIEDDEKRWEHYVNGYYMLREVGSSTNTRLFIKEDTGDVGIATTDPQSKFHVNGEMRDNRGALAGLYLQYGPTTITNGNNTSITQINGGCGIIRINSNHNTYIPFWTSGGGGVAYTILWLDPDSGDTTSNSFSYAESGSNANAYTVSMGSGNGVLYIQATTMPSNYTVRVYRWF